MSNKNRFKEQALIFDRKTFKNKAKIKRWFKNNNRKLPKKKDPIRKYKEEYRVRMKDPKRFKKTTFKTIIVSRGVVSVKGKLR